MAKLDKKKKKPIKKALEPTKKYILKVDYPTSRGVKKAGQAVYLTEKAAETLIKLKKI
tara:strand:+ start:7135 stop:7308 length:174 start_codon:yes stop_codon:yes gene_type:complete